MCLSLGICEEHNTEELVVQFRDIVMFSQMSGEVLMDFQRLYLSSFLP
jgi:hypothetical protein